MENNIAIDTSEAQAEQSRFVTKVYGWMAFALSITGLVSYLAVQNPNIMGWVFTNWYGMVLVFGLQAAVVIFLITKLNSMSAQSATAAFILYSIISGFVFSSLFFVITDGGSLASTFFIAAVTYFIMGVVGHTTKSDLTTFSRLLMMTFVGLVIATAYNWYMDSTMLYWVTAYSGILLFTALVAYDTRKLKEINIIGNEGSDDDKKEAVEGALCLYLDFIDILFIFILLFKVFGKKKEPVAES